MDNPTKYEHPDFFLFLNLYFFFGDCETRVPNKIDEVYRYNEIHYEAYTLEDKKISVHAKGFLARLIQHQIDHLNGKLYIDYLCNDCRFVSTSEALNIMKIEK
ncbi:peptide deformylase [Arsenophonus sp. PmNCSU2021_1]|uniref:peptide deformylase n=1 Tax=Arsenophonus sp. PmNCSU2021_1 TaxID=3118989 RepID=UPI002FEEF805